VHHAASASGLPVPSRTIALVPETAIESWAPTRAAGLDSEVLEWIASQMRGKLRGNRTVTNLIAAVISATTLSLAQLPNLFDMGM
jgi:predicted PurR-regulated permease PerM